MLTDEEISARCAAALPILGTTRTAWLKESLEFDARDNRAAVWACRAYEVLVEMVGLVEALRWAMGCVPNEMTTCNYCDGRGPVVRHEDGCPFEAARRLLVEYTD